MHAEAEARSLGADTGHCSHCPRKDGGGREWGEADTSPLLHNAS